MTPAKVAVGHCGRIDKGGSRWRSWRAGIAAERWRRWYGGMAVVRWRRWPVGDGGLLAWVLHTDAVGVLTRVLDAGDVGAAVCWSTAAARCTRRRCESWTCG